MQRSTLFKVTAGITIAIVGAATWLYSGKSQSSSVFDSFSFVYKNKTIAYVQSPDDSAAQPSSEVWIDLSARLFREVTRVPNGQSVFLRLENPQLSLRSGQNGEADSSEIRAALAKGFHFELDADGLIRRIEKPDRDAMKMAEGIVLELVSHLQVSRKEDKKYTARESDAYGRYDVDFTWSPDQKVLTKNKKIYTNLNADTDIIGVPTGNENAVADFTATFTQWKEDQFTAAKVKQFLTINVNGQKLFESETQIEVNDHRSGIAAFNKTTSFKKPGALQFVDTADFAQTTPTLSKPAPTIDEIRQLIPSLEVAKDVRDITAVVLKVREFIGAHPEQTDFVLDRMEEFETGSAGYMALMRAIITSKDPSVQNAFVTRVRNNAAEGRDFVIMLASLADFPSASDAIYDTIRSFAEDTRDDVRSTAILAQGALAGNASRENDPRAAGLVNELKEKAAKTQNLNELSTIWGGLGNSGDASILEDVMAKYAQAPSDLKPRLLNALRFVSGTEASNFLLDKLQHGESGPIRMAAITALHFRKPNPEIMNTLFQVIEKEKFEPSLSQVLSYLLRNKSAESSTEERLKAFIKAHPNLESAKTLARDLGI